MLSRIFVVVVVIFHLYSLLTFLIFTKEYTTRRTFSSLFFIIEIINEPNCHEKYGEEEKKSPKSTTIGKKTKWPVNVSFL